MRGEWFSLPTLAVRQPASGGNLSDESLPGISLGRFRAVAACLGLALSLVDVCPGIALVHLFCFCVMCIALFYIVCISMVVGDERAFAMSDLFSNPLSAVVFSYVFNVRAFGRPNSFPNSLSAVALCITRDFGKLNYVLFWFPSRLPATL